MLEFRGIARAGMVRIPVKTRLTARNLLDRLPWESVPLGLRILLHRAARLAQSARAAHRATI